jgi:hypothetical protein
MDIAICLWLLVASIAWFWRFGIADFILDELWLMESLQKVFFTGTRKKDGTLRELWRRRKDMRALLMATYRRDLVAHTLRTDKEIKVSRPAMRLRSFAYHGLFCVLVFALLRSWTTSTGAALAGAAIVLVHPMSVPAVVPISGRSSLMCGIFYLAAIMAPLAFGWYGAVAIPFLLWLGYKCKEEMLFWPLGALVVLGLLQ